MDLPFKKVLVLAPHTDDGEFGCGGTISRLVREGCAVRYVAFSDCKESVPQGFEQDVLQTEMRAATTRLGISDVHLLDYKVRYFHSERQRILEDMVRLKKDFAPDAVFTPCTQDIHQDHSTITTEAIRAYKDCTIMGYELPWNNLTLPSSAIVKLQAVDVDTKVAAIAEYKSQQGRAYSDPAFLRAQALTRGTRIRSKYAEAFEMIRFII